MTTAGNDEITLSGPVSQTGTTRLDAPLALAPDATVTQTFSGPFVGSAPLTLNNAGRVILSAASPTFTGPVTVSNGILEVAHSQSLGGVALPSVTVADGGSLAIGQAPNNSIALDKTITIAGSGPDGLGALRMDHDALQYNAFKSIALADDAAIGGIGPTPLPYNGTRGRFDIRNGLFDFAGHSLSKVGSSSFILTSTQIAGVTPDTAIDVEGGILGIEASTDLGGSAVNTLTVADGAGFDFHNLVPPVNWSLTSPTAHASPSVPAPPITLGPGRHTDRRPGHPRRTNVVCAQQHRRPDLRGRRTPKTYGGYTYLYNPANTTPATPPSTTRCSMHTPPAPCRARPLR